MIERNIPVGSLQCNCRLLFCEKTGRGIVIDPGDEPDRILKGLQDVEAKLGKKLVLEALFHTHAHFDHFGATRAVKERLVNAGYSAPSILLHAEDEPLYQALQIQGQMFGQAYDEPLPVDRFLTDEETLQVGSLRFTAIHTPGHSPGSLCLRLHEDSEAGSREAVYSGDTLFQGSIGRSDIWGGDGDQLIQSIRRRLLVLDEDTEVCPGHGPESRIGIEKRQNPFLR